MNMLELEKKGNSPSIRYSVIRVEDYNDNPLGREAQEAGHEYVLGVSEASALTRAWYSTPLANRS